jgi:uncharacterized protein YjdB
MQRSSRRSLVRAAIALTCMLVVASCDTPLATQVDDVDRIVLTPSSANVQAGGTVTLSALVLDATGNAMRERKVVWASENASIATVSQSGVVTGIAAGVVQIAASSGGKSANATITVTSRPVSLVRVTPGSATIAVTGSVTLQAEALDAAGVTVSGRPVAWSSSSETIAVVSGTGVVAGLAPGSVTITATIDGQSGTSVITVAPQPVASVSITPETATTTVGGRVIFRATPLDAQNLPLAGRTISWTSNTPAVATVSSSGEALGLSVGTAKIKATVEGQFAEATITIEPVPVAGIVVAPTSITLNPGQTSQLTVTLTDSAGNVLTGRQITYSTSDAQIATVSSSGVVTAVGQGSAQIQASSGGKTASVSVTVNAVPVASIRLTPSSVSLRISQTMHFTAQALDAQGNPLPNRTFTWISGSPTVATVNQSGDVVAVGIGIAAIFAATEGISASATVTVTSVPVASVQVSPATVSLQQGGSSQLTVVVKDAAGNVLTGRPIIWASSNDAIAVVSSTGRVTAVSAGSAVITATSETVAGTSSVTVSNVPVASVTITPANPTLGVGQTLGMTATMRDAANNILSGRAVTWASQNQAVATVDAQGVVTAVASGSATLTATSEGVNGTTLITVSAVPVARVDVAPTSVSLNPGQTSQLTATAYDASNNVLVRPVTWSSGDASVATVSATGLVTAVALGTATISATSGGVTGTSLITVALVPVASVSVTPGAPRLAPNDTLRLTATAFDGTGNVISGRPTTWASSNNSIATVSTTGLVTAVSQTTEAATITATIDGVSGSATVLITPITSVVVTPSTATIALNLTTQLSAVARNAAGNVLTPPITWVSQAPGIASVSTTGLVTATGAGSTTIEARANGAGANGADVVGTAAITVNIPVATVTVTSPFSFVVPGDVMTLGVVLKDAQGNVLTGRTITFSSDAPGSVAVDAQTGVVTGGSTPGTATITATSEGINGTVSVSSVQGVASMTVTGPAGDPTPQEVPQGTSKDYTVTVTDGGGNPVAGLALTVAATSNPAGIVTITSPTSVTTDAAGKATVTVSAGTAAATSTITFTGPARRGLTPPGSTPSGSIAITVP